MFWEPRNSWTHLSSKNVQMTININIYRIGNVWVLDYSTIQKIYNRNILSYSKYINCSLRESCKLDTVLQLGWIEQKSSISLYLSVTFRLQILSVTEKYLATETTHCINLFPIQKGVDGSEYPMGERPVTRVGMCCLRCLKLLAKYLLCLKLWYPSRHLHLIQLASFQGKEVQIASEMGQSFVVELTVR